MIELAEKQDVYLSHFASRGRKTPAEPAWLDELRTDAIKRYSALGFPDTHAEDWKYTNVAPIARIAFRQPPMANLSMQELERLPLTNFNCGTRLVFVNGHYSPTLSKGGGTTKGVRVENLGSALQKGSTAVGHHFARHARLDGQAFPALNTALFEDGALVEIADNVTLTEPIHLIYVSQANGEPHAAHPRNLITAGRGSRAAVIETYVSASDGVYFTNAITEIYVSESATLDHYKIQNESSRTFHVGTIQASQGRGSVLHSHNVSFGAALARNDINSVLEAEGAECILNGLFVVTGTQHVDNHTALDHASPHCNSRELYKGILDGQGAGVFNGKIKVHKDAQKTNALQSNKNLLLSADAVINTKPQLEIFADDVRCTHGATVGHLDEEAQFYMQSRGITRQRARDLLTYAFAGELFDRMGWAPVREQLEQELYRKLSPENYKELV